MLLSPLQTQTAKSPRAKLGRKPRLPWRVPTLAPVCWKGAGGNNSAGQESHMTGNAVKCGSWRRDGGIMQVAKVGPLEEHGRGARMARAVWRTVGRGGGQPTADS